MFGEVVRGVSAEAFEDSLTEARRAQGAADDIELTGSAETSDRPLPRAVHRAHGRDVPRGSPTSSDRRSAPCSGPGTTTEEVTYRRLNGIPDETESGQCSGWSSAATGPTPARASLSAATRPRERPSPRRLPAQPQGEDVVARVHNTEDLSDLARRMPEIHRQLIADLAQLEGHYRDMQDVEYTSRRRAVHPPDAQRKRPAQAAVRSPTTPSVSGLLDRAAALHTITHAGTLEALLHLRPRRRVHRAHPRRGSLSRSGAGRDRVQRPSGRAACRGGR